MFNISNNELSFISVNKGFYFRIVVKIVLFISILIYNYLL